MKKTIYAKDYKILTAKIKEARKNSGLDQNKAAKLIGRTQSYISKVESGQVRIDVIQLKELAKIYKTNIKHFL